MKKKNIVNYRLIALFPAITLTVSLLHLGLGLSSML